MAKQSQGKEPDHKRQAVQERADKEHVVRLINVWLRRSGLRQVAVAQRVNITPDDFYQWYKNVDRPLRTDPDLAIKIIKLFAEQPSHSRATAAEAIQFLIRTHLPLDRFAEIYPLFPTAEWQQAIRDVFPDQEDLHRLAQPVLPDSVTQTQPDSVPEGSDTPYLLISLSTDPENTWSRIYLTEAMTKLGRLDAHEVGPTYVSLQLPHVSHEHAQIIREPGRYLLKNCKGTYGIGLYERSLERGDVYQLRHGDRFRIPNHDIHFRVMFLLSNKVTLVLPLHMEQTTRQVFVFEQSLTLAPLEYDLLMYLYNHRDRICTYEELIAYIWPGGSSPDVARMEQLGQLLTNVRDRIAGTSGGFTFMQTIGKLGVRLVV